jgi:hypothetical protein
MILPIRSRVLQYLSTVDQACADDVMEALKVEYGDESQYKKTNFIDHLLNLEANGLIDQVSYDQDSKGELRIYYKINDYGIGTINRYLPKKWRVNA